MSTKKITLHTLGCKLNFAETSFLGNNLLEKGFEIIEDNGKADAYIINTCSVTDNANKECRMLVRNILKKNPDAFIAVIGCYAQLKPQEIADIEGVDLVLGANEKFKLAEHLVDLTKKTTTAIHSCEVEEVKEFNGAFSTMDRTRTFLKVQDGCKKT